MKRLLAPFVFFTRLPFWRLCEIPADYFKRVVELWPLVGWLTGGVAALTLWGAWQVFSPFMAAVVAIVVKTFVTGALHEDGFADFCDGMGGGTSRTRVLEIMKDSHIGTYGVAGLALYYLMLSGTLSSMPLCLAVPAVAAADTWSKFCASNIINLLPYARKAEEAKSKTVYSRMSPTAWVIALIIGGMPLLLISPEYLPAAIAPAVVALLMIAFMKKK